MISHVLPTYNRAPLAFVAHVGDFEADPRPYAHSPDTISMPCTDERYAQVLASFQRSVHPLVLTPGDNDWADCHFLQARQFDPRIADHHARIRGAVADEGEGAVQVLVAVVHLGFTTELDARRHAHRIGKVQPRQADTQRSGHRHRAAQWQSLEAVDGKAVSGLRIEREQGGLEQAEDHGACAYGRRAALSSTQLAQTFAVDALTIFARHLVPWHSRGYCLSLAYNQCTDSLSIAALRPEGLGAAMQ